MSEETKHRGLYVSLLCFTQLEFTQSLFIRRQKWFFFQHHDVSVLAKRSQWWRGIEAHYFIRLLSVETSRRATPELSNASAASAPENAFWTSLTIPPAARRGVSRPMAGGRGSGGGVQRVQGGDTCIPPLEGRTLKACPTFKTDSSLAFDFTASKPISRQR